MRQGVNRWNIGDIISVWLCSLSPLSSVTFSGRTKIRRISSAAMLDLYCGHISVCSAHSCTDWCPRSRADVMGLARGEEGRCSRLFMSACFISEFLYLLSGFYFLQPQSHTLEQMWGQGRRLLSQELTFIYVHNPIVLILIDSGLELSGTYHLNLIITIIINFISFEPFIPTWSSKCFTIEMIQRH